MKKTLSMIVVLSITLFAEENLTIQEQNILQENSRDMKKMDKVDTEIRVIDVSIEKHKISILKTFREMANIFDNYKCEELKGAVGKLELYYRTDKIPLEEREEGKEILARLTTKSNQKCKEK